MSSPDWPTVPAINCIHGREADLQTQTPNTERVMLYKRLPQGLRKQRRNWPGQHHLGHDLKTQQVYMNQQNVTSWGRRRGFSGHSKQKKIACCQPRDVSHSWVTEIRVTWEEWFGPISKESCLRVWIICCCFCLFVFLSEAGTESFKQEAGKIGPVFSGREVLYVDWGKQGNCILDYCQK